MAYPIDTEADDRLYLGKEVGYLWGMYYLLTYTI